MIPIDHSPTQSRAPTPAFVSLPNRGGDPVCGLSRSFWYNCERAGWIALRRLRRPGTVRPRVLLPVADAIRVINERGAPATTKKTRARR